MNAPCSPSDSPYRARAAIVALPGAAAIAAFVQWSDMVVGGTMAAGPFPPLAACLLWGALLLANTGWARRCGGKPLLNGAELLIVLAVWLCANMVAGRGLLHPLLCSLAGPAYVARSGAVQSAVAEHLPEWLAVTDRAAAAGFFEGAAGAVPWSAWARPLGTWALFLAAFLTANISLAALLERPWIRGERLAFPLVALATENMPEEGGGAMRSRRRALLAGMAFPLLLHGFGVANAYAPAVPCIPFWNDFSPSVTQRPWTAALPLYLNLYPLLIGVTFLAPADVSFGLWVFLLLHKVQMVAAAATGWSDGATGAASAPPYVEEQSAGAFLVLAGAYAVSAWRHARTSAARPPRWALWGLASGVAGLLAWCVGTGLPLWFAACFFGFVLGVAVVLARLMAEGGVPWILAPVLPDKLILSLTGSAVLGPEAVTRLMLHVQHLRDTRQMLAPAAVQAGRLREAAGARPGAFHLLVGSALVISLITGLAVALPVFYARGALLMAPASDGLQMSAVQIPAAAVAHASTRLSQAVQPSPAAGAAMAVGGAATWALTLLRARFAGWPLHPLGYALTGTLQLGYANKMLFSVFLGWSLKSLALRLGGARGFRELRSVALGLVLGDLAMGGVLKLLDAVLGPSSYAIF